MSKINISFNDATYEIDKSALAPATANLVKQLEGALSGTGAVIHINGLNYNIDSAKLVAKTGEFTTYLGTIAGNGMKLNIGGVEYLVDADKLGVAVSYLGNRLAELQESEYSSGLSFMSNGDGTCAVTDIGECTDTVIIIPVVSPDGDRVTSIDRYAFYECYELTSVTIPSGVTSIGDYAFYGCSELVSINIPNNVISIGENAFWNCDGLTNITIPAGVSYIGPSAFENCDNLNTITIPDGVTTIHYGTFQDCSNLTTLNLPDSLTAFENWIISNSPRLRQINFAGTKSQWNNITKSSGWNISAPAITVYCLDGTIYVSANSGGGGK